MNTKFKTNLKHIKRNYKNPTSLDTILVRKVVKNNTKKKITEK